VVFLPLSRRSATSEKARVDQDLTKSEMFPALLSASLSASNVRYGIMVDAGSSGTRAHIYTWAKSPGIPNVQPAPNSSAGWVHKVKIPLANAANDPVVINTIFRPIIEFAAQRIPSEFIPKTRIFVYATAGMRLLSDFEQEQVLGATFNFLTANSAFRVKRANIRVIDGIEEGVFGWLSVNHLLGNLVNRRPTVGALDMGGASFQIALEVGAKDKAIHHVRLGSQTIPLYSYSYLGYGANEALKQVTRALVAILPEGTLKHPCYPLHFKEEPIEGTGDFERCAKLAHQILIDATGFEAVQIPNLGATNNFVAMASFYYANKFLDLPANSTLAQLKTAATKFCGTDWQQTLNTPGDPSYKRTYCWYAVYQWVLLTEGYHFADGKTVLIKLDDIDGVDLSWTIGAMLSHAGEIEIDDEPKFAFQGLILANVIEFCVLFPLYVWMERKRRAPRRFSG
jgi:Golgi nucleoside diphosphatase